MDVLFADDTLAIVNKPAGLMMHGSRLSRGETDFAADRLRAHFGRRIFLAHRLDRATSGCLLLCFDPGTAAALGQQFMSRAVDKHYLAVCRGWPEPGQGQIDHPLDGGPGRAEKKPALTDYTRLAHAELPVPCAGFDTARFSLLLCQPRTGRFRQIRRHLKHVHHHLIGDTSHGDGRRNRMFRVELGVHRMLLHAWRLRLVHPLHGGELDVHAPLDAEFLKVLGHFGWPVPEPMPVAAGAAALNGAVTAVV